MIAVNLPDKTTKSFKNPVAVIEVAKSIGNGLAKATIAAVVDGKQVDNSYIVDKDCTLKLITDKDQSALEVIRHSTAHLLAQAVQRLYPKAQVTIGPVIADGFYYDFAYKDGFSNDDLDKIEIEMQHIVKDNLSISRTIKTRDEAVDFFKNKGEVYKADIIASIPNNETLSFYQQGEFIDLCRGPHVPSTKFLKAFKLTKVSGAYWRGNSDNEMLQRIYGTAWLNKEDLSNYLTRLEEAKKRDHRLLAKTQDLFHFQEQAPGMVFWHAKGWKLYQIVKQYMRQVFIDNDYQEVHTPHMLDKSLWEASGHWDKFNEEMFITRSENRDYAIKPMNCPAHIQIYNTSLKSYKDLPLRLAEFGSCHRNEPSGTLHGLMRARNFVQDDGHIFCAETQIQDEVTKFIDITFAVYKKFGFENIEIKLSTRPEKRVGNNAIWDKAEKALEIALNHKKLAWTLQQGEGAFYGPKIEFVLKDCLDRSWQCGTLQVDFSMPKRLGASYIDHEGKKQTPVMLHRAILGSLERFVGILIEHYAGSYPLWLAPLQVMILNISAKQEQYVKTTYKQLIKYGIRVKYDLRNEKIGFKIRQHSMQRYPYLLVIGDKEVNNKQVTVRKRGGKDLGAMNLKDFIKLVKT